MCVQNQYYPLRHIALSIGSFWKNHPKLMALYTGYFDESGDEEKELFIMGGVVIDAEQSPQFDNDWLDAIRDLPKVDGAPLLHTTDFVSGNDIYARDWKGRYEEKSNILSAAARVISKHCFHVFSAVINIDHLVLIDSEFKATEMMGHPYAVALQCAYGQMVEWGQRNIPGQPIRMVVEERQGMGDAFEVFRLGRLPMPIPEKKSVCALQAADWVAWMRAKQMAPTTAYDKVKASWGELYKHLYQDQYFDGYNYVRALRGMLQRIGSLPLRDDADVRVIFSGDAKNHRRPFRRKGKR